MFWFLTHTDGYFVGQFQSSSKCKATDGAACKLFDVVVIVTGEVGNAICQTLLNFAPVNK